ncbi:MAG: adenylate/guanylate cyclase domain-containing protein [Nitriliruptorales bacterium]|nr:adenylate/guanylate cyclase domain-containing protein [Nitriliruptorales bacterium]
MGPIQYAKNDGVHLAYQVVGEGDRDIVWVPGWFSDLETMWDVPGFGDFLRELARMGRLILFDKRGMGQSDRGLPDGFPTIEEWVDDVICVMDTVGSERASLVGLSEGGTQSLLAAARHPQRVESVVAISAWVRILEREDEVSLGIPKKQLHTFVSRAVENWGSGKDVAVFAPSRVDDALFIERWASFQRRAASPSAIAGYGRTLEELDIRDDLPRIQAPTLVLSSEADRMVPAHQFAYLADNVPDVRAVELPGRDHVPFYEAPELLLEEVQRHLIGHVRAESTTRRFAAVLFADIVSSTDRAAAMGDRSWRATLDAFEEAVERTVREHSGRVVKSTGDGSLAIFADPQAALLAARTLHRDVSHLGVRVRAGLHCGQIEVRGDDVGGIAVHIAARVSDHAPGGATVVSSTVRDVLLGSSFEFTPAGTHELKGVPGEWHLFELAES